MPEDAVISRDGVIEDCPWPRGQLKDKNLWPWPWPRRLGL